MFSIIIPVYNEEKIIKANIKKLMAYLRDRQYEIIIANNGSQDRTFEIASSMAKNNERIKVVSVDKKGPGLAFKRAARAAIGDILISQDMDLSTDLGFIDQAVQLMGYYDLVIGSKQTGRQERSFSRRMLSASCIFLTNYLLGMCYDDYSMAAKAYKKDFVLRHQNKLDDGTSYVIELIYLSKKAQKKIASIPVNCFDKRKSKFNVIHESLYRFNRLISLFIFRLSHR